MASVLGFTSALTGGILADKYRKNPMSKGLICVFSSLLATPPILCCFIFQSNFTFSVIMLGLNYLTAEAWGSPAITMLMDVVS